MGKKGKQVKRGVGEDKKPQPIVKSKAENKFANVYKFLSLRADTSNTEEIRRYNMAISAIVSIDDARKLRGWADDDKEVTLFSQMIKSKLPSSIKLADFAAELRHYKLLNDDSNISYIKNILKSRAASNIKTNKSLSDIRLEISCIRESWIKDLLSRFMNDSVKVSIEDAMMVNADGSDEETKH